MPPEPCCCNQKMILRETGCIFLTDPPQHGQEWWCGGCGRREWAPNRMEIAAEEVDRQRWEEANHN